MKLLRIILASIVMMTLSGISVVATDDTVSTEPILTDPIIIIDDGAIPMEKNIDGTGVVDPGIIVGEEGTSVEGNPGTEVPPDAVPINIDVDPIVTIQDEPTVDGVIDEEGVYYMTGAENQRSASNNNETLIQIAFASGFVVIAYALSKKLSKS